MPDEEALKKQRKRMMTSAGQRINNYMLAAPNFSFDPRRYWNFFDDVFAPHVPSLGQMRKAAGSMSASYYELWKVKGAFDIQAFLEHFNDGDFVGLTIHLCIIRGEDHELIRARF